MLIYGGVEILAKKVQYPKEGDIYVKLRGKRNNYFSPQKNVHFGRYLFLKKPNNLQARLLWHMLRDSEKMH